MIATDRDEAALVGQSIPRNEDQRLVRGRGRYLADVVVPGCLQAVFVRSSIAHGRVRSIDTAAAVALDGVVAVLTVADLPHVPLVDGVQIDGLRRTPQSALVHDHVRYVGEPVAIVVATTTAMAEDAADLVFVDCEPLQAIADVDQAMDPDAPLLFPELGSNCVYRGARDHGDAERVFAGAAHTFTKSFTSHRSAAVPMETRGCIADFDSGSGRLEVISGTQSPHLLRRKLAVCLELGEHHIRVLVPDVGGAFGQKIPASPEEVAVALASRHLGRPVRWIEDRRENLMAAPHAKEQRITLSLAMDADGTFLALKADIVGDAGAYSFNSASALIEPYVGAGLLPGVYRIRHVAAAITAVVTNKSPIAPYRGVGWTATHSVRELLIDEAARALGMDPVALRRRNMVGTDDFPYDSATGMHYDSGSYVACLDTAKELTGYEEFRRRQAALRDEGRYVGIGFSPYVEPTGWGSEGAQQSAWSFASHDTVRVEVQPSGHVLVFCGTPSQGQGHATTLAQVVADAVGVTMDGVRVIANDTDATPVSIAGTRASRVAVITGGAASRAGATLNRRLREVAAALLEADGQDVTLSGGVASVVGSPDTSVTIQQLAAAAYFDPALRSRIPEPDLVVSQFLDPKATYSNGMIAAIVEVDVETGQVHVDDLVAVEDCGTIINPAVVDGQIRGAVAQGVGAALLERMVYSDQGQPQSTSFVDYLLPSTTEVPPIRIAHHCSPSPYTVNGVKGVGESGLIATPAAVANAVADAMGPFGVVIDELPIAGGRLADAFEVDAAVTAGGQ